MWICANCGQTFDEPKLYQEYRGEYWGTPAYETYYTCPYCGDDCVDEEEYTVQSEYNGEWGVYSSPEQAFERIRELQQNNPENEVFWVENVFGEEVEE